MSLALRNVWSHGMAQVPAALLNIMADVSVQSPVILANGIRSTTPSYPFLEIRGTVSGSKQGMQGLLDSPTMARQHAD